MIRKLEKGQILLIVILVVIVISTIGLSLVSRSITSLRSSTEEAESQKALAAAEAGIERELQSTTVGIETQNFTDNKSRFSTDVDEINGSTFQLNGGAIIQKDEGADVWLVPHDSTGNPDYRTTVVPQFLNLYWGSSSDGPCDSPAIQVIAISRDNAGIFKSYRFAYDSCPARKSGNNFADPASGGSIDVGGTSYSYAYRTPNNDLRGVADIVFIRIIPLYKDTIVGVCACNNGGGNEIALPSQGFAINSTGVSGAANRKLIVFKGYPQTYLPYLSYGLFVASD